MTMPPPQPPRPAAPGPDPDPIKRPGCACCREKRSLRLPGRVFACPLSCPADNQRMAGRFGPAHPG